MDIKHPIHNGRRGTDVSGGIAPQLGAGAGIQRVQITVDRANINYPIRHCGRGLLHRLRW